MNRLITTIGFLSWLIFAMVASSSWAEEPREAAPEERPHFDVMEYQIEGNSVLPATTIEKAVYPGLGAARSIDDVEKARSGLERAYHDAGYPTVVVDIPEQKVGEGVVILRVTEGTVSKLRVQGSRYYSQGRIVSKVPSLAEGGVPFFPEVQQELTGLNRSAERRVTPVLRPGKLPGTTEIDLNVEDRSPLHGSLELNNRQSPNTSPLRLLGTLHYDNLWQQEHSLTLQVQTAPQDVSQVKIFSGSYVLPVPDSDKFIALYGVHSRSNVATALGGTTVFGAGDIAGVRAILPLPSRDQFSHSLTLGLDYKSFQQNVTVPGSPGIQAPISYVPVSGMYSATLQDKYGISQASAGVNFSLRGFLNKQAEFENNRFNAKNNFFIFKWDLQRTEMLPFGFSLFGRADGQIANQPLISNEQFVAGGVDTVRGYLEATVLGDNAVHGTLELRSPPLPQLPDWVNESRMHIFVEGARLRVKDPLPQQQSRSTLSSAGIGLRLKARKSLNFALDAGWPFQKSGGTGAGQARIHFTTAYEF